MLRRDFFKAISAAAAAIAAGSTALARPTPRVKVSADTRQFRSAVAKVTPASTSVDDQIAFVRTLLKECRVVAHDLRMQAGEWMRCRVVYRHAPNAKRSAEDLHWEQFLADAKILSVVVSTSDEMSHGPVRDVEIEYIVPPARSKS